MYAVRVCRCVVCLWCLCAVQMPVMGVACVVFLCGKVFLHLFELCVVYVICDVILIKRASCVCGPVMCVPHA